jgi:SAM-dependent methyltransferase
MLASSVRVARDEAKPDAGVEFLSPPSYTDFPEAWYELSDPDHFWCAWRLRAFLGQAGDLGLPRERPLRVLDVGAGAGVVRDQLEACTEWTVDIADLNLPALEKARPGRGRTLYYNVLSTENPLPRYDVALLFDVLEHIAETRLFVEAVLRHLEPGGHLFVNVPAGQWLMSAYDRAAGHLRRYSRATLSAEFAGTGLEILDTRYWGLLLVPLLLARKLVVRETENRDACIRSGFEPPGRLAHALLRTLMRTETALCSRPWQGSSLLLAGRKLPA